MSKPQPFILLGVGMIVVSIISFVLSFAPLQGRSNQLFWGVLGFCFGVVSILLFFLAWDKRDKEKLKVRQKEQTEFEEKERLLKASPHYKLIEGYVATTRFGDYKALRSLRELLKQKGFELDEKEVGLLVQKERNYREYQNFENKIKYNRPTELKQYIYNFLDAFPNYSQIHVNSFMKVLKTDEFDFNEGSLAAYISAVEKELELKMFERKLLHSESHYSIEDLDILSGQEFEYFLKDLFAKMGYSVEQTKTSGDQGADLILSKFGSKVVVQAKRYSAKVNNKAIQEVVAAIKHYGADRGMVVTTSQFTTPATKLAQSNGIELVDRFDLEKLMQKYQ